MSEGITSLNNPPAITDAPPTIELPTIDPEPMVDQPEAQQQETSIETTGDGMAAIGRSSEIFTDNGIFDFMTTERAIELYERIHLNGLPELEWKFYGRRQPNEQVRDDMNEIKSDKGEAPSNENQQDQTVNTEFDFDEELSDLHIETSIVNESLSLNRRPEPGSDKKTNLSDIMSDIMKGSLAETE